MPTTRKRKTREIVKPKLSENVHRFLLTGELKKGDFEVFLLAGSWDRLEKVWDAIKKEILTQFIKINPCTRPYCFWLFAGEPRKQIGGSGDGWTPGMAIDSHGLPKYWQLHWNKDKPLLFESEALYLQRHGFLSDAEKAYLEKHPEVLQPEIVMFNENEGD